MLKHNPSSQFSKLFLVGGLSLFLLASCKKDSTNEPVIPGNGDPAQFETPFTGVPNTSDIVMYEINERAFSSSGTLAGIQPRLDSIKSLGVNVIWLMPVYPIGAVKSVNSPYSVKDYKAVNPEFGNLDDLRNLVREAHKRNMAVILDWVANHTSWDNDWIKNKNWYTQDGNGNIISPAGTNWQDVADLNYNNSEMRLAMIKAMKYWILTSNVDGYRCDAADFVPFMFWKQAIDSLRQIPNHKLIMLAEGARSDHFTAGFNLNFSWNFLNTSKDVFANKVSATAFYQTHFDEYSFVPAGCEKLRFTSNHDICAWDDTPLGLFGGIPASMSAFAVTAFMGGVPLIYNGQEVGCPVKLPYFSKSPIDWTLNPDMMMEYKWLMSVRSRHAAVHSGTLSYYPDESIVAFRRKLDADEVVVFANTRSSNQTIVTPSELLTTSWKNSFTGYTGQLTDSITLGAYGFLILEK
ncbi:MAG: alpha-amylase [Bacteroidetes bacterium]|nr:alpha-amylase [Bacteroidota bacterium]